MHILFIGYSNVIKKRILPFIHEIKEIKKVDIAKYCKQTEELVDNKNFSGSIFNDLQEAIKKSKANIAYISVVNSAHAEWVKKALNRGMHVIVDKPSFLNYHTAVEMVELAKTNNLCIAEATVYPYHIQFAKLNEILSKHNLKPNHLTINFSFPPLNPENFRYNKELGGGAIYDQGPYTISPGRLFFKENPKEIYTTINSYDKKNDIETSYSILAKYSNGKTMIGHFGFNTEYINRLFILGNNFSFELNRVFTPPSDIENEIIFKQNNNTEIIKTSKSNCFLNFIQEYIEALKRNNYSRFTEDLLSDALGLEMLKNNVISKSL